MAPVCEIRESRQLWNSVFQDLCQCEDSLSKDALFAPHQRQDKGDFFIINL